SADARRRSGLGPDRDLLAVLAVPLEGHDAGHQREERVVPAHADALARVDLRAELADEDVAGDHPLAAELLDAAPLAVRIAAVAVRALPLLVSHGSAPARRPGATDPQCAIRVTFTAVKACRWPRMRFQPSFFLRKAKTL